jgi:hypothetical protein
MAITNLETLLLKVLVPIHRQEPRVAPVYLRSLQLAVKSEDLLVVAREGFEICSKILGCEALVQSAGLIAGASFVSAVLDSMSIPSTT